MSDQFIRFKDEEPIRVIPDETPLVKPKVPTLKNDEFLQKLMETVPPPDPWTFTDPFLMPAMPQATLGGKPLDPYEAAGFRQTANRIAARSSRGFYGRTPGFINKAMDLMLRFNYGEAQAANTFIEKYKTDPLRGRVLGIFDPDVYKAFYRGAIKGEAMTFREPFAKMGFDEYKFGVPVLSEWLRNRRIKDVSERLPITTFGAGDVVAVGDELGEIVPPEKGETGKNEFKVRFGDGRTEVVSQETLVKSAIPKDEMRPQWSMADALGLFTDIAMDPQTYLAPFGSTELGRIAASLERGRSVVEAVKVIDSSSDLAKAFRRIAASHGEEEAIRKLTLGPNLREQFARGQKRFVVWEAPFRKPKLIRPNDWRLTKNLLSGTPMERIGRVPVSAITTPGGALLGAAVAPEGKKPEGAIAGAAAGAGLGVKVLDFHPAMRLRDVAHVGPPGTIPGAGLVVGATLGYALGGDQGSLVGASSGLVGGALFRRSFDTKLGYLVGGIPIMKLPAFEPLGFDQSWSPVGLERGRRIMESGIAGGLTDIVHKLSHTKYGGATADAFVRYRRPYLADPVVHKDVVHEFVTLEHAMRRAFPDAVAESMHLLRDPNNSKWAQVLEHMPEGPIKAALRDSEDNLAHLEFRRDLLRLKESPGRDLDEKSINIMRRVYETSVASDFMTVAEQLEMSRFLNTQQLEDGRRETAEAIRLIREDLQRLDAGEAPLYYYTKGKSPEEARTLLETDLVRAKKAYQDRVDGLSDLHGGPGEPPTEPGGGPKVDPDAPPPSTPEELGITPAAKPDPVEVVKDTPRIAAAPDVKKSAGAVRDILNERDALAKQFEAVQEQLQRSREMAGSAGMAGLDEIEAAQAQLLARADEITQQVSLLDDAAIAEDFRFRLNEAQEEALKRFGQDTESLISESAAAKRPAIEALEEARGKAQDLQTEIKGRQAYKEEDEVARLQDRLDKLGEETVADYIKRVNEGIDPMVARNRSRRLLAEASRTGEEKAAAERTAAVVNEAKKDIEDLRKLAEQIRKADGVKTEELITSISGRMRTLRPKLGDPADVKGFLRSQDEVAKGVEMEAYRAIAAVEDALGPEEAARLAREMGLADEGLTAPVIFAKRRLEMIENPTAPRSLGERASSVLRTSEHELAGAAQAMDPQEFAQYMQRQARRALEEQGQLPAEAREMLGNLRRVQEDLIQRASRRATLGERGLTLGDLGFNEEAIRAQLLPEIEADLGQFRNEISKFVDPHDLDLRVVGPHVAGKAAPGDPVHGVLFFSGPADVDELGYALRSNPKLRKVGGPGTGIPDTPIEIEPHVLRDGETPEKVIKALSPISEGPPPRPRVPGRLSSAEADPEIIQDLLEGRAASPVTPADHAAEALDPVRRTVERVVEDAKILAKSPQHMNVTTARGQWQIENLQSKLDRASSSLASWKEKHLPWAGNADVVEYQRLLNELGNAKPGKIDLLRRGVADIEEEMIGPTLARTRPSAPSLQPTRADGSSVVAEDLIPESVRSVSTRLRPDDLSALDDLGDALPSSYRVYTPGQKAEIVSKKDSGKMLEDLRKKLARAEIKSVEFSPETRTVDITTGPGGKKLATPRTYQIPLVYNVPEARMPRKAFLAKGTYGGKSSIEHYLDDFLRTNQAAPELRTFRLSRDMDQLLAGRGVGELTPAESTRLAELRSRLEGALPSGLTPPAKDLSDWGRFKAEVNRSTAKWLRQYPVERVSTETPMVIGPTAKKAVDFNKISDEEAYRLIGRRKAAVKAEDGTVVTGWDHGDAFMKAEDLGLSLPPGDLADQASGWLFGGHWVGKFEISDYVESEILKVLREKSAALTPVPQKAERLFLTPTDAGLTFGRPGAQVYGAFRDVEYPIGFTVDVGGKMGKITGYGPKGGSALEDAAQGTRLVQFEDGTVREVTLERLLEGTLEAASRRGESILGWLNHMAKNEDGSVNLGVLDKFMDKVRNMARMRREIASEISDRLIRVDPEFAPQMRRWKRLIVDEMDALLAEERGHQIISNHLPFYAMHVKQENEAWKFLGGGKSPTLEAQKYSFQKHRQLQEVVDDINRRHMALHGKPLFHEDILMSMAYRKAMSKEAIARAEASANIASKFGLAVKDFEKLGKKLGSQEARIQIAKEVFKIPDERIARAREILPRINDIEARYDEIVKAHPGIREETIPEIAERRALVNEYEQILPPIGMFTPKGSFRFFHAETVPKKIHEAMIPTFAGDELDLLRDLWKSGDEFLLAIPESKIGTAMALTKKGMPAYFMPQQVIDVANRYIKEANSPRGSNRALIKAFDFWQNRWVNWTLFPVPVYHFRNRVSDLFLAMQHGVHDVRYWERANDAWKGRPDQIVNRYTNEVVDVADLIEEMKKVGALTGWSDVSKVTGQVKDAIKPVTHPAFIAAGALTGAMVGLTGVVNPVAGIGLGALLGSAWRIKKTDRARRVGDAWLTGWRIEGPVLNDRNFTIAWGRNVGDLLESQTRLASAMYFIERDGLSVRSAIEKTQTIFGNFGSMTNFEQAFMRRIFPFYGWSRRMIPQQLKLLVTRPSRVTVVGKIKNAADAAVIPEPVEGVQEFGPEYITETGAWPLKMNPDGSTHMWIHQSWIPTGELLNMNRIGFNVDGVSYLMGMVTPLLRTPIEVGLPLPDDLLKKTPFADVRGANYDFFYKQPLKGYRQWNGMTLSNRDIKIYNNFRWANMWSKMWHNPNLPWYTRMIEPMTGRAYDVDFLRSANAKFWQTQSEVRRHKEEMTSKYGALKSTLEYNLDKGNDITPIVKDIVEEKLAIGALEAESQEIRRKMLEGMRYMIQHRDEYPEFQVTESMMRAYEEEYPLDFGKIGLDQQGGSIRLKTGTGGQ